MKEKQQKIKPEDARRAVNSLSKKLMDLEGKLKKFRSSSPEKWIQEFGLEVIDKSDYLSPESFRSSGSEESTNSGNSEDVKTIAENENFIKQKLGDIEKELCVASSRVMVEGISSLKDDLQVMENGLEDMYSMTLTWDSKGNYPPFKIIEGLLAFKSALGELSYDALTIIKHSNLRNISDELQSNLEIAYSLVEDIFDRLKNNSVNRICLKDLLQTLKRKFKTIRLNLNQLQEESSSLVGVDEELDDIKNEVKINFKNLINPPNKVSESSSKPPNIFDNLIEEDFKNLDSMLGYEITDYVLRKEEEEILALRNMFLESKNMPKLNE